MKIGEHRGLDRIIDHLSGLMLLVGVAVVGYSLYRIVSILVQF